MRLSNTLSISLENFAGAPGRLKLHTWKLIQAQVRTIGRFFSVFLFYIELPVATAEPDGTKVL